MKTVAEIWNANGYASVEELVIDMGNRCETMNPFFGVIIANEIEDLRARVAQLEADENEGAITAMPIQIGDDLCYLPVNAHGVVKRALADAARYQWLRRWRSFHGSSYPTPPYVVRCALNPLPAEQACNGDELDAAIDTSLAAIETTERELHK